MGNIIIEVRDIVFFDGSEILISFKFEVIGKVGDIKIFIGFFIFINGV